MANKTDRQLLFEDVPGSDLLFLNFEGKAKDYNAAGQRNFCVKLSDKLAAELEEDGWKIQYLKPREDDETGYKQPFLKVKISYDGRPPQITTITSVGRTNLTEDLVAMIDTADILKADMILNPFDWDPGSGMKTYAYLKTLFVVIDEDPLQLKYAHLGAKDPEPVIDPDDGE